MSPSPRIVASVLRFGRNLHWLLSYQGRPVRALGDAGLVLVCSDERKCAVMKGCLCSDKLRRYKWRM